MIHRRLVVNMKDYALLHDATPLAFHRRFQLLSDRGICFLFLLTHELGHYVDFGIRNGTIALGQDLQTKVLRAAIGTKKHVGISKKSRVKNSNSSQSATIMESSDETNGASMSMSMSRKNSRGSLKPIGTQSFSTLPHLFLSMTSNTASFNEGCPMLDMSFVTHTDEFLHRYS